jgi:hypothetical protein
MKMFLHKNSQILLTENKSNTYLIDSLKVILGVLLFLSPSYKTEAQVVDAQRSGFTWISTENVTDKSFGSGYTFYSAAWPIFQNYPGPSKFQMGLGSCWLTTQRTGSEPEQFYTTIEGGLGWWGDTRFGTKIPKFIMGGVSLNFHAWANGPGAGKTGMLPNGQRDWSSPGGKYGIAQLSNRLLWAPDGLNLAQSLNGEMLGYGYTPLPLTDELKTTQGKNIETGNQCWTLFLNSTNFKGPATFFLPTFWTEPSLTDPSLEGLFLDSRPSEPNIGFGIEHAHSPALISADDDGYRYAKIERLQFPVSEEDNSIILHKVSVYSQNALWNDMGSWFNGGSAVLPEAFQAGAYNVPFINNGGSMSAEISRSGMKYSIDLNYIDNIQMNSNTMGFEFDLNTVFEKDELFILPEYFRLDRDNVWQPVSKNDVPASTNLLNRKVNTAPRTEIAYLTPVESDCQWQDPESPWNKPGPTAGPFKAELGDGSTLTYYWYRYIDQPAIIQANYPEDIRAEMQRKAELIHSNWSISDNYMADPEIGNLATLDPKVIVQPPAGLEIGYVPIVTRQEKTPKKVRVFVLAGQSNMEGYGIIEDAENDPGSLLDVIRNDLAGNWAEIWDEGDWKILEGASLYFARSEDTIRTHVTVGQGAYPDLIGPELMFAQQMDEYYDDPVLIIKTAWGGKNLAVDFRPPSAGGETGAFYQNMIKTVHDVTHNLAGEFPDLGASDYEISGFVWFQGWNDGESDLYLNEYESNLSHLVNDVRNDFNNPDLPIVIASSGQGGFERSNDIWVQNMQNIVSVAQENVGCNDSIYGGSVGFVQSKQYYLDRSESPQDAIHHFNHNALTYLNIGKAMGKQMILSLNNMAFCYSDCGSKISPGIVSIGNRVWNDYDRDGINDPNEPGIPGVSLVLWGDSDGDEIPDWRGFGGVQVTDEEGYYRFSGLKPGNYLVFVWSLDNWGVGEPLRGFRSTSGYVADANNDVDFDNNGYGSPNTDIKSGIVTLSSGDEPLNDGDPFSCYFDYDASGNNTVDFGFYNPNATGILDYPNGSWAQIFPNPVRNELIIESNLNTYRIELSDTFGRIVLKEHSSKSVQSIDTSALPKGIYFVKVLDDNNLILKLQKVVKI